MTAHTGPYTGPIHLLIKDVVFHVITASVHMIKSPYLTSARADWENASNRLYRLKQLL